MRVSAARSILVRLAADHIVGMEQSASAMDADIPRRMDARDTSAALATLLRGAQRRTVEFSPLFSRTGDEVSAALGAERHHHALMQAARPTLHHLRQLRGVLVEGIVKNQIVFKLSTETTSLAVAYLDVFLGSGKYAVQPEKGWAYHLVANACMTLAVKFQEPCDPTDPRPDAAATQRHVDVAFDRVCVQKMESLVLQELGWRLNPPTPAGIIPRLLILLGHDPSDDEFADICARIDVYALAILYDVNFSAARATCVAGAIVAVVLEDREGYHRDEVIRAIVTAFDDPERIGTESIVACARLVDDFRAVLSSSSAGDAIAGE